HSTAVVRKKPKKDKKDKGGSSMPAVEKRVHTFPEFITAPAMGGEAVTPSDTVDLTNISRALYVGGAGAVVVTMRDGNDLTFSGVPAGKVLDIRVSRVKATGTTATLMIALY
ncbi:MAG: spike base protein, RCAP_Rcc01079 family, partial [Nitrososphaera sp.]